MGFFSKIADALKDLKAKTKSAADNQTRPNTQTNTNVNTNTSANTRTTPQQTSRAPKYPPMPADMKAHFDTILREEFGSYEILENVPVAELNSAEAGSRPYTYVLFQNGQPRATIMLTKRGQSYVNREFIGAKKGSEALGIPFFNFFTYFANERSYVVNRIKNNI